MEKRGDCGVLFGSLKVRGSTWLVGHRVTIFLRWAQPRKVPMWVIRCSPYPKPTGPFTMERGQSPSLGGPSLLKPVDQVPGIFKAPQAMSGAQTSSAVVDPAKESPVPSVKAGTARLQASTTVTGSAGHSRSTVVRRRHRRCTMTLFPMGFMPGTHRRL